MQTQPLLNPRASSTLPSMCNMDNCGTPSLVFFHEADDEEHHLPNTPDKADRKVQADAPTRPPLQGPPHHPCRRTAWSRPHPTPPRPTLPYPTLSYPILSYPILSYPIDPIGPILSINHMYPTYLIYIIFVIYLLRTVHATARSELQVFINQTAMETTMGSAGEKGKGLFALVALAEGSVTRRVLDRHLILAH